MTAEVPVGMLRAYAGTETSAVDYWEGCRGIQRGQTMVTSGPLLWVSMNGKHAGETISLKPKGSVTVAGELETIFPVVEIEIVVGGKVAKRIPVTTLAIDLVWFRPAAIRGTVNELIALGGLNADSDADTPAASVESAVDAAVPMARLFGCVVAASGAVDYVTDGESIVRVANGHEYLAQIAGGGSALGLSTAAFLAVREDESALEAVVAAHVACAIASEMAAADASGPGTFMPLYMDALTRITADCVQQAASLWVQPVDATSSEHA